MDASSPQFISCEELFEEFKKCPNDPNKRILLIDVRDAALYNRSHLCLDSRMQKIGSIRTKMRVMNIDPDLLKFCIIQNIMTLLNDEDKRVFSKRRDATEVVIIERNTSDIEHPHASFDPKSKIMRLITALTRLDIQRENKITVPIKILRGGFRAWLYKYPHFTTDSTFDPDTEVDDIENYPSTPILSKTNHITPSTTIMTNGGTSLNPELKMLTSDLRPSATIVTPEVAPSPSSITNLPYPTMPAINKPVPTPPIRIEPSAPLPPKPQIKTAPGTAVPISPLLFRPVLPRSHSSPNVAQAEGDELDDGSFERSALSGENHTTINNNHIISPPPKPRIDRSLKPINGEASRLVEIIRHQLNFGNCPEATEKKITGLQNLGNTCFMNSVIQCLAYAPELVDYLCSNSSLDPCSRDYYNDINFTTKYGTGGRLAVEFGALVETLNSHRYKYIEPKSFREAVTKYIGFAGNEQQDSHEFMMMLFDKLHHDLNIHARDKSQLNGINGKSNSDDSNINIPRATLGYQFWKRHIELNKSVVSNLFEGIFMSTLTCTFCKGQSNTFEVFNCLSLPIPSETRCHVRDCLSHFSNPERIEAAWECPRCKLKREADKKIVICKLPRILIIHLKRFSLDGRWRQKLQTTVDFPLSDLSVDYTNVLPQSAYGQKGMRSSYNLFAVVNHYGHLDGGHYTAYCKLKNQRWYTVDDSNVSELRDADVCGQAAYILFYGSNS